MADRRTLAISKIDNFKEWLEDDGWAIAEPKGYYEVLRAYKPGRRHPLIVHRKLGAKVHYSVAERDMGVVRAYMKDERQKIRMYDYEHRGYVLQQTSYNWHYMIFELETGQCVLHASCTEKLTEKEAKEHIDLYIENHKKLIKEIEK